MDSDRVDHTLGLIDGAIRDYETSGDAMRWTPEHAAEPALPLATVVITRELLDRIPGPAMFERGEVLRIQGGNYRVIQYMLAEDAYLCEVMPEAYVPGWADERGPELIREDRP